MKSALTQGLMRFGLAIFTALAGGLLGQIAGQALVYAIADWTDRDIAELKDMLIWGFISGTLVGALAAVWLSLRLTGAIWWVERTALGIFAAALIGCGVIMTSAFDWPKSSGTPIIKYELRLPAGSPLPARDEIGITIWSEKSGQGCYIDKIRMAGERPEIAGDCSLYLSNLSPTVSLRLNNKTESYWRLPYKPDTPLEAAFGPWRRIEFIPTPRPNTEPLPQGDYEIRYRVRKYM
jgi:hypothetical protein